MGSIMEIIGGTPKRKKKKKKKKPKNEKMKKNQRKNSRLILSSPNDTKYHFHFVCLRENVPENITTLNVWRFHEKIYPGTFCVCRCVFFTLYFFSFLIFYIFSCFFLSGYEDISVILKP